MVGSVLPYCFWHSYDMMQPPKLTVILEAVIDKA